MTATTSRPQPVFFDDITSFRCRGTDERTALPPPIESYVCNTLSDHSEFSRSRMRDVDNTPGHIRSTIVDAHRHRTAGLDVGHTQLGAERHARIARRQFARV